MKAKQLEWTGELDSKDGLNDTQWGFWIIRDDDEQPIDEGYPIIAGWGEGPDASFETVEEAKAWCQAQADAWVRTVADDLDVRPAEGVALIAAERKRQVEVEAFTPEHDREHARGELEMAAVAYAFHASLPPPSRAVGRAARPAYWPWDLKWWKPGPDSTPDSRLRELAKAGALIAAAMDVLLAEKQAKDRAAGG